MEKGDFTGGDRSSIRQPELNGADLSHAQMPRYLEEHNDAKPQ